MSGYVFMPTRVADLQTIEKVIPRLEKEVKIKKGSPELLAAVVKAKGWVRIEGKEYLMHDGDVVEFRTGLTSGSKK